jgi:hypothetical protein
VLILDGPAGVCAGSCLTFEFLQQAKSQHYYPRYGFNDTNGGEAGYQAGLYPADELKGALNVGWVDFQKPYDAGIQVNQRREQCYSLMRRQGVDMSNQNAILYALWACDQLWFMQAVFAKIGSASISASNFMAAVNQLGYGYDSPSMYAANFASNQHDAAAGIRYSHWSTSCKCFQYSGGIHKVG